MFKKYVGMVSGAVQKYVDNNLAKCPFCGEDADWQAAADTNIKSSYPFRCTKCGAVISVPTVSLVNPFKIMPENMTTVDCGAVNGNNLYPDTEYSLQFLISSGLKLADTNKIKADLASGLLAEPQPAAQAAAPPRKKRGRRVMLTVLFTLLLAGGVAGALYGIFVGVSPADRANASVPIASTAEK